MKVILYTTPTNTWCGKAKDWLKKHKVAFEERSFEEEKRYAKEVLDKTGQLALPVLDVNGKTVIGFNEEEFKKALGK